MTSLRIREATAEDRDFMFAQAAHLAAVSELRWHAHDVDSCTLLMHAAFARPASESGTFIAEDDQTSRLGFVHVEASTDPGTLESCAYLSLLAVIESAQGRGMAARLMEAAEDWARQQGFRLIALDVLPTTGPPPAFMHGRAIRMTPCA